MDTHRIGWARVVGLLVAALLGAGLAWSLPETWTIHDPNRPPPAVVDPGTASTQEQPGRAPSDALVLFDGSSLDAWRADDGGPAAWRVADGALEVVRGAGMLWTREAFGDFQLHVEWSAPAPPSGEGQGRGNSGVYLMGRYEVQVLDSYQNATYPDGQAAAVYGQYPPLVNACRPPGEWQAYDIIFHGPRFGPEGELLRRARVTVLHNGVVVQDGVELTGPTAHGERLPYGPHPE